ncbi:MAG: deoxynucleotide monophosphate kinase family protein [Candidatus Dormibacteria bacterium]
MGTPEAATLARPGGMASAQEGRRPIIVGIGHRARVGKDTLASALVARHGFARVALADALRVLAPLADLELAKRLQDHDGEWERAKAGDPYVREALQRIGEGCRQVLGRDVWLRALIRQLEPGQRYVIPDVRYRDEAVFVRSQGGVLIKVTRPGYDAAAGGHVSEHDLDDWPAWDLVVSNKGTIDELLAVADSVAEMVLAPA